MQSINVFSFFIYICYNLRMIEVQRIQMNELNLQLVYICIVICEVAEWYQFTMARRLAQ